jgi:hypothetical protein
MPAGAVKFLKIIAMAATPRFVRGTVTSREPGAPRGHRVGIRRGQRSRMADDFDAAHDGVHAGETHDFDDTLAIETPDAPIDGAFEPAGATEFSPVDNGLGDPGEDAGARPPAVDDANAAAAWAEAQPGEGLCAVASVGMVASRIFGEHVDQASLVGATQHLGLLDDTPSGLTVDETAQLLDRLGVPSSVAHGTLDELRTFVAEGRGVILALDGDEIDGDDDRTDDARDANHALVVTAIDDTRNVVVVNDPGRTDGAGLEVPIERLLDAWADADNAMVVTEDVAAAVPEGPEPPRKIVLETDAGNGGPDPVAIAGYVLLPVSLGVGAFSRRHSSPPSQ